MAVVWVWSVDMSKELLYKALTPEKGINVWRKWRQEYEIQEKKKSADRFWVI
jgi:hypothetical protein